jgi:glycosyltransferase involved in cell wall biosynthesis
MVKLLIVHNKIYSYREQIFDILKEYFDITVAFSDPSFLNKNFSFKTIYTPGKWTGPFFIHDKSLHKLCSDYDAVLALYEVRCLSIMRLSLHFRRKYSLTYWGIGVSASYSKKYDENKIWDGIRYFFGKKAESIIFYSSYPVQKYINAGFEKDKLFVAENTTAVSSNLNLNVKKEAFLFVGTLYKQKGIDILMEAYNSLKYIFGEKLPFLNIIGEGPERNYLEQWISSNDMTDKVFLHGAIYDPELLRSFYEKSIVCISPNQAGLSVLTSMGYATAFVTDKNAITGGEIFNIKNMINGIIYEGGVEELKEKLIWVINNQKEVVQMGKNAKEHYDQYRTPELLANSLIEGVKYALAKKNNFTHSI